MPGRLSHVDFRPNALPFGNTDLSVCSANSCGCCVFDSRFGLLLKGNMIEQKPDLSIGENSDARHGRNWFSLTMLRVIVPRQ
jgi:hypothetical protein